MSKKYVDELSNEELRLILQQRSETKDSVFTTKLYNLYRTNLHDLSSQYDADVKECSQKAITELDRKYSDKQHSIETPISIFIDQYLVEKNNTIQGYTAELQVKYNNKRKELRNDFVETLTKLNCVIYKVMALPSVHGYTSYYVGLFTYIPKSYSNKHYITCDPISIHAVNINEIDNMNNILRLPDDD